MAAVIFPSGGSKNISWLDKLGSSGEKIGTSGISLDSLKRLASISDIATGKEEDVNVGDATVGAESPVPVEENEPISENVEISSKKDKEEGKEDDEKDEKKDEDGKGEKVEEKAEKDEKSGIEAAKKALEDLKAALESDDKDAAKAALQIVEDSLNEVEEADKTEEADEVAEIPVSLDESTGEMNILPEETSVVEVGAAGDVGSDLGNVEGDKATEEGVVEPETVIEREASSSRFYKIAMLSPDNKKKLGDYWIKILGYDADYVKLMLKDYEK